MFENVLLSQGVFLCPDRKAPGSSADQISQCFERVPQLFVSMPFTNKPNNLARNF